MKRIINKFKELTKVMFIKDTLTLEIGTVSIMAMSFITSIIMARTLHAQKYGVYALILSLYGLVNFFEDFGIKKTTVIRIAEARAKKDYALISDILALFLKLSIGLGLCIFVIGFIFSPFLAHILYGNKEIGIFAGILFLTIPLKIFYEFSCAVFHGFGMMRYLAINENIFRLCKTILIVLSLLLGFELWGIIISLVMSSFICSIIAVLMYEKIRRKKKNIPSLFEVLARIGKIRGNIHFNFGLLMALDKSVFNLFGILPVLLLARVAAYSDIGSFKIAKDLITSLVFLFWPVYRSLCVKLPIVLVEEGKHKLKKIFLKVSLVSGIMGIMLAVILLAATPWVINSFYGQEYFSAVSMVYLFLIYFITAGFTAGLPALYQAIREVKPVIHIKIATMIALLPLGVLLIKLYDAHGAVLFFNGLILFSSLCAYFFINRSLINFKTDNSIKGA